MLKLTNLLIVVFVLSAIADGRAAPPDKTSQGKSSINASAKIFMPRASGWLMELSMSEL
jgi:hypothetical protein